MRSKEKMPDISGLQLFDSCVTLGKMVFSGVPEYLTTRNILSIMDHYKIHEALVHDHHARITYPREHGNDRLLKSIRKMPRLHPVWVLEPPKRIGAKAAQEVVNRMLDHNVKAARLRMKVAPPLLWLWSDLLNALDEHRIPCFLDFGQTTTCGNLSENEVNGVREIALAYPRLPLILSHVLGGLGINYAIVPLIKRIPNLRIDIAGILEFWREVALDVGPERVLFASAMPFVDPGILISNVQYARGLNEGAKRMICGDNLRKLLGGVR